MSDAATPCGLTVLRCCGTKQATKRFAWNPGLGENGAWVKTSFDAGWTFIPVEHRVADLRGLADLLEGLRADPRAFIVRGALSPSALADVQKATASRVTPRIRRLKRGRGDVQPTLIDLPRAWACADIDNWRLRGSDDLADDPETAIDAAIHELLPPAFHDVDYFWQLSASAGFTGGVLKVHLWFLLTEPATNRHLKAVFRQHAPQVDNALFDAVQVHYVADPIIEGRPDPIPRRTGWHDGLERAVELPALAKHEHQPREPRQSGTAGAAGDAQGVEEALAHLGYGEGGRGFHEPLRAATWCYAVQCDQHGHARDDQALKDDLWEAIQVAPCHDGRDIKAQYRDGPYLQDLIDGAFRVLASNPQHPIQHPKQLSVAGKVVADTVPIQGTLGEYHLKQVLGIPPRKDAVLGSFSCWPESIRYHPDQQSIVAIAYADDGSVQAARRLPLAEDGSAAGSVETDGVLAGATVRLPGPADGPLLLALSVKGGLAAWASTEHETWVMLDGFDGLTAPAGRLLVLVADDHPPRHVARDGAGVPARRLHKAVRTLRRAGAQVVVATPLPVKLRAGFTFADAILQHGPAGIAERIDAAIKPPRGRINRCDVHDAQRAVVAHTRAFTAEIDAASARMIQQINASRKAKNNASLDETWDAVMAAGDLASESTQPTEPNPVVKAIGIDVGVGKSSTTRAEFAERLIPMRARGDKRAVAHAVPDHALGAQQKALWADLIKKNGYNLSVEAWRSREAPDPEHPDFLNDSIEKDDKAKMCAMPERTSDAKSVILSVQEAVCLRKIKDTDGNSVELKCPSFDVCSFQVQRTKKADVWIVPHSSLTHKKPEAIGELAALIVDESSWLTGLIGIETDEGAEDDVGAQHLDLPLLALGNDDMGALQGADRERLLHLRRQLFIILGDQPDGPLCRETFLIYGSAIAADAAAEAKALERGRKVTGLNPGQTKEQRREAMVALQGNKTIGRMVMVWDAIRLLLAPNGPERSGWLELATERQGDVIFRMLRLKKRGEISKGWQVPTLILDATMNADLLRPYWPNVEVLADVRVATPHQRIFQVVDRAYSQAMLKPLSAKAAKADPDEDQRRKNRLRDLRANVFHIARLYAPGEVLVIMQLAVKDALLALGPLPPNVLTAHHNSVAGRDEWRHVRAAVIVGRTQPKPVAVERICEALTGQAVANPIQEGEWYYRVDAVREMADGSSLLDETDRHPDPLCEAIRWQICEGQVLQGIGRTRGVWREAENPCDVWVLGDSVLPLAVDGLIHAEWLKPTIEDEMIAAGGVVFENSGHAAAANRDLWETREAVKAADWRAKVGTFVTRLVTNPYFIYHTGKSNQPCHECPNLRRVDYQLSGAGKEPAVAWFDPALCPDIAAALTTRLADFGSLAWLRVDGDTSATEPTDPIAATASLPSWAMLPAPAARMLEVGGVVLTSSRDAVEVYGSIWKAPDAARKAFQRADMGVGFAPVGLRRLDYLRAGRGQQPASAWFDPALAPSDVKMFLAGLEPFARWEVSNEMQPDLEPPAMPASPASPEPEPAYVSSVQRDGVPALRPEVSAYVAPDGHTVLAKCPFCDMPHYHGGFGPRHAHCANPSGRIYVLCDAGPAPASILDLPMERNNTSAAE